MSLMDRNYGRPFRKKGDKVAPYPERERESAKTNIIPHITQCTRQSVTCI